ncbi:hypothetical protein [Terrarubrum flagellatum]|uniref:hypothetical protein n=1 Tax=Terrirubrum flagellatum TaxID=2895980 RepID=UPI0031456009
MKTAYLIAAGSLLALSAAALPGRAAPLSHSALAVEQDQTLVETARHWRHYGWYRGRHHGWYGPRRHYGYYGYRRPYWDRPYYGGPRVGFYFGVGPRYGYW